MILSVDDTLDPNALPPGRLSREPFMGALVVPYDEIAQVLVDQIAGKLGPVTRVRYRIKLDQKTWNVAYTLTDPGVICAAFAASEALR